MLKRIAIWSALACLLVPTAAEAAWRGEFGQGHARVSDRATDAPITATVTCTVGGVSAIELEGYDGDRDTDPFQGKLERVYFVVDGSGGRQAFAMGLYFGDIDRIFASHGLMDPNFLAAWAAGRTMTLHKADGSPVATWALSGTAKALRGARRACGDTLSRGADMAVPLSSLTGGGQPAATAAATAQSASQIEEEARRLLADTCGAGERLGIGPEAIRVRDLTGDGAPDAVVSFETVTCDGRRDYCGAQVCSLQIFVNTGGSLRRVVDTLSTAPAIGDGSPPMIEGQGHGGRNWALQWDGVSFVSPY